MRRVRGKITGTFWVPQALVAAKLKNTAFYRWVMITAFVIVTFLFSSVQAANVTLAWNPAPAIDTLAYRLHYGTTPHTYSIHRLVAANVTTLTVPNLQSGVTYYFAVTAINKSKQESAYSAEVSYTVPLPIVSVVAGTNASEPSNLGSFLFTRTGDASTPLVVSFTLDGDAQIGVDYKNPGASLVFPAGRTNAVLWIRPIANRIFEGAKTLELALNDTATIEVSPSDSAAILIGDDDRPSITISAAMDLATGQLKTTVHADAVPGFNVFLQTSPDSADWSDWAIVAAPPMGQPVNYSNPDSAKVRTRFYRTIYIRGELTETSVTEAISNQLYSANIVGTVSVPLQPGWNLVANPLNGAATNGPLGNLPAGTIFLPFGSTKADTYTSGRWNRGIPLTRSTMGGWLYNPSAAPNVVSYIGEVPSTAGKPTIPAGWSVRSSVASVAVDNDSLLGYPLHAGDALFEFNPAGTGSDAWTSHFRGTNGWDNPPTLTAGQGIMIYKTKSTRPSTVAPPTPPAVNLIRFTPIASN